MVAKVQRGDGSEASALERAAELLGRARLPVIGGLLTDIGGAQAAIALAQKLGGIIDHAAGDSLTREARIRREAGTSAASFGEVRNRADMIVVIGDLPLEQEPDLLDRLFPNQQGLPRPGSSNPRELILLGSDHTQVPDGIPVTSVGLGGHDLSTLIARLGAAIGERRDREGAADDPLGRVAQRLKAAAFAVFVYSAAELDEPALFTILDAIRHLSVSMRAATLAIAAPGNGDGVNLCSTWTCGLPVRTSFAGSVPVHDAKRFATTHLIESGEADALVWIDALAGQRVPCPKGVPTIVLTAFADAAEPGSDIVIEVACAGREHDAALYLSPISGIGMVKASRPKSAKPTVAAVLTRIAGMIDAREAAEC